jgi:Uma2 family endonuclease
MSIHEIVLTETKPETEWVRGRALQKTGGTYTHSALQMELAIRLRRWTKETAAGRVAMQWRFRVAPPGQIVRPLVPDVAFLSYDALPVDASNDEIQVPICAPTVVFEVLAPEDKHADLDHKIETYLAAGSAAVILVDPDAQSISVYDRDGSFQLQGSDDLVHPAVPRFSLNVGAFFATAMADAGR